MPFLALASFSDSYSQVFPFFGIIFCYDHTHFIYSITEAKQRVMIIAPLGKMKSFFLKINKHNSVNQLLHGFHPKVHKRIHGNLSIFQKALQKQNIYLWWYLNRNLKIICLNNIHYIFKCLFWKHMPQWKNENKWLNLFW